MPRGPRLDAPDVLQHVIARGNGEISSNSHRPAAVTARAWVSYAAIRHHGLTPTQVAQELGVSRQSVLRGLERAEHLALDPGEKPSPLRA